jgi:hypothetical protein
MSLRSSFLLTLVAGSSVPSPFGLSSHVKRLKSVACGFGLGTACSLITRVVSADAPACFPACRSGYVCSPEAKCVSLCNPPCGDGETCAGGECQTKVAPASSSEPIKDRMFELGLGGGYQRVGSADYFAPALAFRFVLPLGLEPHLVFGVRAGAGLGPSIIGEFALDLGYRHRIGAANAPVRGGFFVTFRPEIWPNAGSYSSTAHAFVGGGSLGGFVEFERLVLSLPLAAGYGKVLSHTATFGYFSASVEAAIRF